MNRTSLRALGLCAAAVLLLPGCGGDDDSADPGTTVGSAPVESAPAEGTASDGTASDGTSADGTTGGNAGTGDAAADPGATNPPVGSGGAVGGGQTGKTGPISGTKVCNRMKELLPTIKQAPSAEMARAQLAMGLGSLYAEAQQLQSLSNVDLDKITKTDCPKTRTQVLTILKQPALGKL